MDNEEINDIILKYLSGECTEIEENEILEWSNSSISNHEYFQNIKYTWLSGVLLRKEPVFESDTAIDELRKAITEKSDKQISHRLFKGTFSKTIIQKSVKYAAIFLLVFLTGGLSSILLFRNFQKNPSVAACYYEIPIGSKGKVILPDGTIVCLNAGSKLSYSTDYNLQSRIVKLEGEGFFEVITNPKKPFIVKARGLDIKAYGTTFNVKAYPDENKVITTLVKGKVFIEGKDKLNKSFTIKMKPKQCITYLTDIQAEESISLNQKQGVKSNPADYTNDKIIKEQKAPFISNVIVNTELYTSWKDNRWVIENAKLSDLAKELERRYNVTITVKTDELKKYPFSGTIQNENIEQVLTILRFALPIKYTIKKDQIQLILDTELKPRYMQAM
jgi:transmembrane sensor